MTAPNDAEEQARVEAIVGAYYGLCEDIRVQTRAQNDAVEGLDVYIASCHRLLRAIYEHQNSMSNELFASLTSQLGWLNSHLRSRIDGMGDQPQREPTNVVAQLVKVGGRGRPSFDIETEFLKTISHRPNAEIARIFKVSPRTIRRLQVKKKIKKPGMPLTSQQVGENGNNIIQYSGRQSDSIQKLSNDELDALIKECLVQFPNSGQQMHDGFLRSKGYFVPRQRIRDAFKRVNGAPAEFGRPRIRRRQYKVAGPNSLWHHDGHHKLIRYKLVTHAFIDGYSRMVVGIHVVNNNKATTVLHLFHQSLARYGRPRRVRGDYGVENVEVARDQEATNSEVTGAYIFGRSVHNVRIERLWRDYATGIISKWRDAFHDLEENYGLDIELDSHIWLLHHLFLDAINRDAQEWIHAWNSHPMQLPRGQQSGRSPNDLWVIGMVEHGLRGIDADFNENPTEYGVDWEDVEDNQLNPQADDVEDQQDVAEPAPNVFLRAPPPRFTSITVSPPAVAYLDQDQIQRLNDMLARHWSPESRQMDNQRRKWILALQFATQLGALD